MRISSNHSADTYLYELRQNMGSSTDFGIERFTGIIWGRFFCVTHHCSFEWENRYTCQKNTAIGIVQNAANGCNVKYFTTAGQFRPQLLLPAYLIFILLDLVFVGDWVLTSRFIPILTIGTILDALIERLTSASKDGRKSLLSLLKDPQHPYNNL